tara:strand:- start:830 stop:973 length:144 start_codon:yes stop_codon:yes gene_type:complete
MKLKNHAFAIYEEQDHEEHEKCDTCGRCKLHECTCSQRTLGAKLSDW